MSSSTTSSAPVASASSVPGDGGGGGGGRSGPLLSSQASLYRTSRLRPRVAWELTVSILARAAQCTHSWVRRRVFLSRAAAAETLRPCSVTLILLLGVSAAIVVRSYMMRRNQRRLIEEAIRNGTYVPPPERRTKKAFGKKPQLTDVYLGSWDDEGQYGEEGYSIHSEKWTDIMVPRLRQSDLCRG